MATGSSDATVPTVPSTAWATLRDYMTGAAKHRTTLPDQLHQLAGHGQRLPVVVASQLWARKTR